MQSRGCPDLGLRSLQLDVVETLVDAAMGARRDFGGGPQAPRSHPARRELRASKSVRPEISPEMHASSDIPGDFAPRRAFRRKTVRPRGAMCGPIGPSN